MRKITAQIKEATYENVVVDCPKCKIECIFNRVSDLKSIMPISGQNLKCETCETTFWATGDLVTAAKYRWFIDDLPILMKSKKYGLYILALCQACEAFMHQAIINKLIDYNTDYRDQEGHFSHNKQVGAEAYNQIYEEFCNSKISDITKNGLKNKTQYKKTTFDSLRSLFLYIFDDERTNKLATLKKLKEDKRAKSFCVLEKTTINKTRNDTIHKNAYRPSFCDIQEYDELINGLYWLGVYLDVNDSTHFLNKRIKPK